MKTIGGKFRAAALIGAAALAFAFAAGAQAQNPSSNNNTWPYATTGKSPVLAVVGDIACQPGEEVSEANGTSVTKGEKSGEVCTDPASPYIPPFNLYQSQEATANQIETMKPAAIALLGDLQYQVGLYSDFEHSFDLTYGAFKFITRPAPGNHEFYDEHGETGVAGYGYFSYFNGFQIETTTTGSSATTVGTPITTTLPDPCPADLTWTEPNAPAPLPSPYPASPCGYSATNSTPIAQPIPRANGQAGYFDEQTGVADGWYSYNVGSWHLISLNIECSTQPGGCSDTGSWFASELAWLKQDLEENHAPCTAAYWHQPTFSATNGITQEGATAQAFWQLLYKYGADLVLNGHDHLYARYRPLDPSGKYDPNNGIRQFTVGTGGETLDPIVITPVTASQAAATATSANPLTETNQEDPSGNTSFNAENLQAYSGDYWGVMALTLDPNGYTWNFESALEGSVAAVNGPTAPSSTANGSYSDKGVGTCHDSANRW